MVILGYTAKRMACLSKRPRSPFWWIKHYVQTASNLASDPGIKVVLFDEIAEGKIPIN